MVKQLSTSIVNRLHLEFEKHNGVFKVNQNNYRKSLKASAEKTGQFYTGSHGIRWTFAKNMYQKFIDKLFTYKYVQKMVVHIDLSFDFVKNMLFGLKYRCLTDFKNNQLVKAQTKVSVALGHNRPSITRHYLGMGATC